ncbi:MAG TPA: DUF3617 domain-containing protein [Allosphingosinicella sp.]|jgi:hypothetical protein|nr:DUF3617 domain-containing protein [Allosphingosinicella sp.]
MKYVLTAGTALLLVACGSQSVTMQPGQWNMTMKVTGVEAPGMPEAALAQMRAQMGSQTQTRSECITPQQAANPTGDMVNAGGMNCQLTDNTFAGGNINVRGTCQQAGQSVQMSMQGTYTATTMQARLTTEMRAPPGMPGGAQSIRSTIELTGNRTGDCASS